MDRGYQFDQCGGCSSTSALALPVYWHMHSRACIPRVDSTTISIVLFMYANEVGAKIAFDDGALLRPSTR